MNIESLIVKMPAAPDTSPFWWRRKCWVAVTGCLIVRRCSLLPGGLGRPHPMEILSARWIQWHRIGGSLSRALTALPSWGSWAPGAETIRVEGKGGGRGTRAIWLRKWDRPSRQYQEQPLWSWKPCLGTESLRLQCQLSLCATRTALSS